MRFNLKHWFFYQAFVMGFIQFVLYVGIKPEFRHDPMIEAERWFMMIFMGIFVSLFMFAIDWLAKWKDEDDERRRQKQRDSFFIVDND